MSGRELSRNDHRRDAAGMTYVYPVLSRRSGGLSIGINLNPDKACNWRCIYCQVEGLRRGMAPVIDCTRLREELHSLVTAARAGDLAGAGGTPLTIRDFAISGDGEPTSAAELDLVIGIIDEVRRQSGLDSNTQFVLITNGSLVKQARVQQALRTLARCGGVVWFKLDRGTDAALRAVNDSGQGAAQSLENLVLCAGLCPTFVQAAFFALDGQPPSEAECAAWLELLRAAKQRQPDLRGVLLYGLARPSHQPEAPRLSALGAEWLEALAQRVRALGLSAEVHP